MKTALSLESQLDLAGPGASQNLTCSMLFEVLVLGEFLGSCFFYFYRFLARLGVPLGINFGAFWVILGLGIDAENEAIFGADPAAEAGPLEL